MYYYLESQVLEHYTFDNLIEGRTNSAAIIAGKTIVNDLKKQIPYNPLLIVGDYGSGKTHILNAIGNYAKQKYKNINIAYIRGDLFINDVIEAIKNKEIEKLENFYKKLDILLFDDIHKFIEQNTSLAQDIFFNIYEYLYNKNKKIVISSLYDINKLKEGLKDRIISRLSSGLIIKIGDFDYEIIMAILRKKTEKIEISNDILDYIIKTLKTNNIRNYEGIINKIISFSIGTKKEINLELVKDIINKDKTIKKISNIITPDEIIDVVSKFFKINKRLIIEKNRRKEVIIPRKIAIYLSTELTNYSLESIGKFFNRDHATVIYSRDEIKKLINTDETIKEIVNKLKKMLITD